MEDIIKELVNSKNVIEKMIPEEHLAYTYWCPKNKDGDPEQKGFVLYAYGGSVLELYVKNKVVSFSLFDKEYLDTYLGNVSEKTKNDIKKTIAEVKNNVGGSRERLKRLLSMQTEDWALVLSAFRNRGYGLVGDKQYLERLRETVIAHNNTGKAGSVIKIIEMESKIPGAAAGKKPDMIGVRKEGEGIIFSYIEYKCTTGAMDGTHKPVDHYRDMKKYYTNKEYTYFENYDSLVGKSMLNSFAGAKKEMLFMFSNIDKEDGMTINKAVNGIERLKTEVEKDGLSTKVKIVMIPDENSVIRVKDIYTIEKALAKLKDMAKQKKRK